MRHLVSLWQVMLWKVQVAGSYISVGAEVSNSVIAISTSVWTQLRKEIVKESAHLHSTSALARANHSAESAIGQQ